MNKNQLTEYADYLLKTAMYKMQNINDAEDLVQETLISALAAINAGKEIDNPKNWLVTVLNRKYYDNLRCKYRKPTISFDVIDEPMTDSALYEQLEKSEDAENIRRCLANLTQLYREVMVRFYMHGESVKQISTEFDIPENTVKSRLDTGRKHIRKEFDMDNYTKQSYEPETLWLTNSGRCGMNNEPFSLIGDDKIKMNLLILAYEKPVTIPELAKAIGISTTYIEPIIEKLVDGELMKRVSDKVYTDSIIYDEKDRTANISLEAELAKKLYAEIWEVVNSGFDELHKQDYYIRQTPSQQLKLDSFFAVRTLQSAVINVRDEACGGAEPFDNYPDRPNGGKWHAIASRYKANYDWGKAGYHHYSISGESVNHLDNYCGLKSIALCEYSCSLGLTNSGYGSNNKYVKHRMTGEEVMKMLYAIHSENENDLAIINMHCLENIDGFKMLGFLATDEICKTVNDIPVIEMSERWELYKLSEKFDNMISEKYHDDLMTLVQNPVKLPPHLKSVPNWQRYMWCCSSFPMLVIMNAHENGLFLAGRDLKTNPAPAVFLAVEK